MAKQELEAFMEKHKITVHSEFVPWSKSRNYKPDAKLGDRSLNWRVTVRQGGFDILTTDYSAGIGHCPSYKPMARATNDYASAIKYETEKGHPAFVTSGGNVKRSSNAQITPDPCDVLYSLAFDSRVLNYSGFEEFANELGYDPDSRKAEAIYRACLDIALKLRNGLGETVLAELHTAAEDY